MDGSKLQNNLESVDAYELEVIHTLVSRKINSFRRRGLKDHDLTPAEWSILGIINSRTEEGGVRVTDVAQMLDVKTTYVTAVLNQLRSKGFVSTRADSKDARAKLLVTTSKGVKIIKAIDVSICTESAALLDDPVVGDVLGAYLEILAKIAKTRFAHTH